MGGLGPAPESAAEPAAIPESTGRAAAQPPAAQISEHGHGLQQPGTPARPFKHGPPAASQPPPSISTDHRASPNRRVRPDLVPPSTPARVNGTPVNGFPVNGVAFKGVRPFGRLAPDIGSGASEAAQNLAPEQNKTAHQSQQQQQLSDQARAGLARMNSSANAAQEGTWVDTSPTSNSPRGQAPTDGYEARASAVASSQSGPEQPQQAKPETLQSSSDSSGEAADKPTAGALTAVTVSLECHPCSGCLTC